MPSSRLLACFSLLSLTLGCQCGSTSARAYGTLEVEPLELHFDGVGVGATKTLPLTLRNAGRAKLTITTLKVGNDSGTAFTVDEAAGKGPLDGASTRAVNVTFTSKGKGNDLALLRISHDGDNGPETVVPLFGSSPEGTCSNPACGAGQVCFEGGCVPVDCQTPCAANEVCVNGRCTGAADACANVTCAQPPPCSTGGACNPATGQCVYPAAADGTSCDDGDSCNGLSTCVSGACQPGTPVACTSPPQCHASAGATCSASSGQCAYPSVADGTACGGGSGCNAPSTCLGGMCQSGSGVCDAPPACHVSTGATCSVSTGLCSYPNAADGTACASGVCSNGACVQCNATADCLGTVNNAAGCFFIECLTNHTCSSTLRHDGTDFQGSPWKVDPVLTAEHKIADNAAPMRAFFDGTNFMVLLSAGSTRYGFRVTPAGADVGATPPFDPTTEDMAFTVTGGVKRYLGVMPVPAGSAPDTAAPFNYIAGYLLDETGTAVGSKFSVLADNGSTCGGNGALQLPKVAGSSGQFMVWAQPACFFARGAVLSNTGAVINAVQTAVPTVRPTQPRVFSQAAGFAVTFRDLTIGGGAVEISGYPFGLAASGVISPYAIAPFSWGGAIVGYAGPSLAWGNSNWLFSYNNGSSGAIRARTLSPNLLSPGAEVVLAGSYANSGGVDSWAPELGFDGSNFFVVSADLGDRLPGQRLKTDGTVLDSNASPILLTPADTLTETVPRLASDRAGRYLLAYRKPDGHTYVRLFSTCP